MRVRLCVYVCICRCVIWRLSRLSQCTCLSVFVHMSASKVSSLCSKKLITRKAIVARLIISFDYTFKWWCDVVKSYTKFYCLDLIFIHKIYHKDFTKTKNWIYMWNEVDPVIRSAIQLYIHSISRNARTYRPTLA